jgi:acyl-CoA thioesterase YciA
MSIANSIADKPQSQPSIIVMAMPKDTNQSGDIFGGWLLAQMDIAGAVIARARANGRIVTVAADSIVFHRPVFVGNLLSFYTADPIVGRTSIKIEIEAWAKRDDQTEEKVISGTFTYVHIGTDRLPAIIGR